MNLPKEAPHFFTNISMDLIPELPYKNFLNLGYFAKLNQSENKFELFQDTLRKYQWALLAAHSAENINSTLSGMSIDKKILFDPIGNIEFSKAIFEFIIYGKASLDSLAQFVGKYFSLQSKPQFCDFKWSVFRDSFQQLGIEDGIMAEFETWLTKDSITTNSISATRDEWIHRGFIVVPFLWPPNELGCFGISKTIEFQNLSGTTFSRDFFFPVNEFLFFHQSKLTRLISSVLEKVVELESRGRPYEGSAQNIQNKQSFFFSGITIEDVWEGVKIGPYSANRF